MESWYDKEDILNVQIQKDIGKVCVLKEHEACF